MADGFEHFQLTGFNDGDRLRAFDGRESFQKIFNGFATFQGVDQILQGDARPDKNGRATHDFRIGVDDAIQIFPGHTAATVLLPAELSSANASDCGQAQVSFDSSPRESVGSCLLAPLVGDLRL